MAADKKKSTALALATMDTLLPEDTDLEGLMENLSEMGDEVDFPRISFKNGKFYFSNDPDEEGVEEFEGLIHYYGKQNTYWDSTYDPKNPTPPICFSTNGKEGSLPRNDEGLFGTCDDCKYNKFGSGVGKGKACRNQIKIWIQRLGTTIPTTLFLAPTSIGSFMQNFIMNKVAQKGLAYYKIITKVKSYKQDRNDTYFRVSFDVSQIYKGEEAEKVKDLRNYWMVPIQRNRSRLEAHHDEDSSSSGSSHSNQSSSSSSTSSSTEEANNRIIKPREPARLPTADVVTADDDDVPF